MRALVCMAALALASCSLFEPSEPRLEVRLAAAVFSADTGRLVPVAFAVVNNGTATAYLSGCPAPPELDIDRLVDGAWVPYFGVNGICPAIYATTHAKLAPGESMQRTLAWDIPGSYRIRVHYGATENGVQDRVSSPSTSFELR